MSKPTIKVTRRIQSEQVRNAFVQVVRPNLPLELKNTRITADEIIDALILHDQTELLEKSV